MRSTLPLASDNAKGAKPKNFGAQQRVAVTSLLVFVAVKVLMVYWFRALAVDGMLKVAPELPALHAN